MESVEPCCSKNNDQDDKKRNQIGLIDLPFEVFQSIIGTLSFADISKIRLVSKHFNHACSDLLNGEFTRLKKTVCDRHEDLKSKMPRRSSVRRNHPLFAESLLIEAVHLRLNVVNLKMSKHLERKEICFYPGGILDEVNLILSGGKTNCPSPTEELFDLSSMAVEHFTDEIKPFLPRVSPLEFRDTSMSLLATDAKVEIKEEDIFDDEYVSEDTYVFKETDETNMPTIKDVISEQALKELKMSLRRVTRRVKKTSKIIKFMKISLKTLTKNVTNLRKMIHNIKQHQNKCGDVDQENSLKECSIKLNDCDQIIESFESQLSNCEEAENILMPTNGITVTEVETGEKNNEAKHYHINSQNEKTFSESESSIPSSSLASTSLPIIPKTKDSFKRKCKVTSKDVLPEEKKIKLSD